MKIRHNRYLVSQDWGDSKIFRTTALPKSPLYKNENVKTDIFILDE